MYATDRQTDVRQMHLLMPLPIRGGVIIMMIVVACLTKMFIRRY